MSDACIPSSCSTVTRGNIQLNVCTLEGCLPESFELIHSGDCAKLYSENSAEVQSNGWTMESYCVDGTGKHNVPITGVKKRAIVSVPLPNPVDGWATVLASGNGGGAGGGGGNGAGPTHSAKPAKATVEPIPHGGPASHGPGPTGSSSPASGSPLPVSATRTSWPTTIPTKKSDASKSRTKQSLGIMIFALVALPMILQAV